MSAPAKYGRKNPKAKRSYELEDISKLFEGKCFDDVLELQLQRCMTAWHDWSARAMGALEFLPESLREAFEAMMNDPKAPRHPHLKAMSECADMLQTYTHAITRIYEARRRADQHLTKRVQALSEMELDDEIRGLLNQMMRSEYGTLGTDIDKQPAGPLN